MDKKEIQELSPSDIAKFADLDSEGFLAAPGEDAGSFKERILQLLADLEDFNRELSEKGESGIIDSIPVRKDERIGDDILGEAAEINRRLYDFSISWVPGFFLSRKIGIFWGGCAISLDESQMAVFLIRSSFARKRKWFLYTRDELLSHELCHIARMPVGDKLYEEFFAYRTSPSAFRRYFGSCFRTQADSILFVAPIFVLLAMQILITLSVVNLPIYPFWILAAFFPAFFIVRNHILRSIVFRAIGNLRKFGISRPEAVAFRSTAGEIFSVSRMKDAAEFAEWVSGKASGELRWKVIAWKFLGGRNTAG